MVFWKIKKVSIKKTKPKKLPIGINWYNEADDSYNYYCSEECKKYADDPQVTITMFEESIFAKLIAWGLLSALAYHSVVGVKHLFMDAGHFEELESGMLAAKAALVISGVLIVLAGVWVW